MPPVHQCSKTKEISNLTNKTNNLMNLVKNTNDKVEKIYSYIFEWQMEEKYSTKSELEQTNKAIDKHQAIIDKITWAIVFGVLTFICSSALLIYKAF